MIHTCVISYFSESCVIVSRTAANVGLLTYIYAVTFKYFFYFCDCHWTIHFGHAVVHQYDLEHGSSLICDILHSRLDDFYGLPTAVCAHALYLPLLEDLRDHLDVERVVIDDKNERVIFLR